MKNFTVNKRLKENVQLVDERIIKSNNKLVPFKSTKKRIIITENNSYKVVIIFIFFKSIIWITTLRDWEKKTEQVNLEFQKEII